jgi:hypothetical protein
MWFLGPTAIETEKPMVNMEWCMRNIKRALDNFLKIQKR